MLLALASFNRYNFEVTNDEVNFLVERALEVDGVFGSKMPCSGNMSCTITLVSVLKLEKAVKSFIFLNFIKYCFN